MGRNTKSNWNRIELGQALKALDACEEAVCTKKCILQEIQAMVDEQLKKVNRRLGRLEYTGTTVQDWEGEVMADPLAELIGIGETFAVLFSSDQGYELNVICYKYNMGENGRKPQGLPRG